MTTRRRDYGADYDDRSREARTSPRLLALYDAVIAESERAGNRLVPIGQRALRASALAALSVRIYVMVLDGREITEADDRQIRTDYFLDPPL